MVHVIATIELAPGARDRFLAEFAKLVPLVRAEVGCVEYGAAVDEPTPIPVQELAGEDAVIVVEKWESLDHLRAHLAAPHMDAYREAVKDLVAGMELLVLEPA